MDLFVLDTAGDEDLLIKNSESSVRKSKVHKRLLSKENDAEKSTSEAEEESCQDDLPAYRKELANFLKSTLTSYPAQKTAKSKKNDYDDFAESMGWPQGVIKGKHNPQAGTSSSQIPVDDDFTRPNLDELKSSTLKAIEKKDKLEKPSARQLAKMKKAERDKTKGKNWFNMPAPELTEELENDLKVLQMRSALDPKHFYKRNSFKTLPKYFQVGTVQHSALDYFSERGERKNKKRSLVDELLADAEFQKYNKRKYKEVMEKRRKTGYHKANQKMKKLKKKKK